MQSYNLRVSPGGGAQSINGSARRFVYESGKTDPEGADSRIVVKPDNGNEIVLRPGQSIGLEPGAMASVWYIRALDPALTIVGSVIIGSGEFEDNSLKVDATSGAITVVVSNSDANRVPVELDAATQKILSEEDVITYTGHKVKTGIIADGNVVEMLTPAENVNGVIIEKIWTNGGGRLRAATSSGAAATGLLLSARMEVEYQYWKRIRVPAGQGIYLHANVANNTTDIGFLFTAL